MRKAFAVFLLSLLLPLSANADTCQPGYYKNGDTCSLCTGATYSDTTDATQCTPCPVVTGELASRATGEYSYWSGNGIHYNIRGCYALFYDDDPDGTYMTHCYYDGTNAAYGGPDSICQSATPSECKANYYNAIPFDPDRNGDTLIQCHGIDCAKGRVCRPIEPGYYLVSGDVTRHTCEAGYYCTNGVRGNCADVTGANGRPTYSTVGASVCTECPAVSDATLLTRLKEYSGWWPNNTHGSITGCAVLFSGADPNAIFDVYCYYSNDENEYGGNGALCQTHVPTECAAGYYSTIENTSEWVSPYYAWCYTGVDCMSGRVCTPVGSGYYSPAGDTQRYACENKPENSHFACSGTTNTREWECDSGYVEYRNACHARCPIGASELHAGEYTHPLFADKTGVPSPVLHVKYSDDTICYAYLESGYAPAGQHGLHVLYNDTVYHAVNPGE